MFKDHISKPDTEAINSKINKLLPSSPDNDGADLLESPKLVDLKAIWRHKNVQEFLSSSQDVFYTAYNHSPCIMAIHDALDYSFLDVNEIFSVITGYRREEILGRTPCELGLFADERHSWKIREALTCGTVQNYEFNYRTRLGEVRTGLITSELIYIGDHKYALTATIDITDYLSMEQALHESEGKYQSLAESISDIFFAIDHNLRFTYWNQASERLTVISAQDALGKSIQEIFSWIRGSRTEAVFLRAIETNEPQMVIQECCIHEKDYVFEISVYPTPNLLSIHAKDITSRKKAEEALKDTTRRIADILNFLPDATLVIDHEGRVIAWNRAAEEMTGVPAEQMLGRENYAYALPFYGYRRPTLADLVLNFSPYWEKQYTKLEVKGNTLIGEDFCPALKQFGAYLTATAAPLYDTQGNIVGAIESIRDITDRKRAEAALEASEAMYRQIVETANEGILMIDADRNTVFANSKMADMLGYSAEEMAGLAVDSFIGSERQDEARTLEDLIKMNIHHNIEMQLLRRDHTYLWTLLSVSPLFDRNGQYAGALVMATDISERKQAEEALRDSNQRISDIINFLPDATIVIDCQGRIIAWNHAAEKMTGVASKEVMGKNNYEHALYFYGRRRPTLINLVLKPDSYWARTYTEYENNGPILFGENFAPVLGKNGAFLRAVASPLYDTQGNLTGAIECIRDATERRRAEDKLRLSEKKFFKAFNSGPTLMTISLLKTGVVVDVNDNFCNSMGYKREEILGLTSVEFNFWSQEERDRFRGMLETNGSVSNLEVVYRTKSGEERIGLVSSETLVLEKEYYLINTIVDITDLRKMEQHMAYLDRLNLVGEIAAGIGHEIRNPMTSVRGFLQFLGEKEIYQDDLEHFELMIEELDRANEIITEFLSLAKNKVVQLELHDLNGIIRAMEPLMQAEAYMKDGYVKTRLQPLPELLLDEREIRQLLLNLVRNGLEAMPAGGILTISTFMKGKQVILAVHDEGPGIDVNIFGKLGTPFFTTKDSGTGLGLPVCFSIAARHQATIDVETNQKGTTFLVNFQLPEQIQKDHN